MAGLGRGDRPVLAPDKELGVNAGSRVGWSLPCFRKSGGIPEDFCPAAMMTVEAYEKERPE